MLPENGVGLIVSSRCVLTTKVSPVWDTFKIIILASVVLNLPPSSANLTNISPGNFGIIASVELPAIALIRSTELDHVADPLVKELARICTLPPCNTSASVDCVHDKRPEFKLILSKDKPETLAGLAVLPTAFKVNSAGIAEGRNAALYENTLISYTPAVEPKIS